MTMLSTKRQKIETKKVHFAAENELEIIHVIPRDGEPEDANETCQGTNNGTGLTGEQKTTENERRTSEITVLSSAHGRARRELRDIAVFDLQSAVKHGTRSRGHNCPKTGMPRWKYVHGNVVYITDYTSTKEITSYKQAVDIVPADITAAMLSRHKKDMETLSEDPQLCATHTIVVIDQSGSMRASDVPGFKTRSQAAYGVLALEYVAEQLHQRGSASGAIDAISIIEMNDSGNIIDECCPLDWIFFNKLLVRMKDAKPRSHGNYNTALAAVIKLIQKEILDFNEVDMEDMPSYAVIFLSDGKPSDKTCEATSVRRLLLSSLTKKLKPNFSFHAIGLGSAPGNFQDLRNMVTTVEDAGGQATFSFSELSTAQLSAAFTSVSTSMTATRTEKMSIGKDSAPREKKDVQLRSRDVPLKSRKFERYVHGVSRWRFDNEKYNMKEYPWKQVRFRNKDTVGFDIESDPFGQGAERLAYSFYEIGQNRRRLGKVMVAKESIHINDEDRRMKFHEAFCRVQNKAHEFAIQFNNVVARTPSLIPADSSIKVPKIFFLECYVYEYEAYDETICGLLVEDYLMGKFTKYNSNNGYFKNPKGGRTIDLPVGEVYLTDFVQAFSHWVYFSTNQKLLVCDLQGVLDEESFRPRFLLTDPCICSKLEKGSRRYGRSDMRMKGIRIFRKNHVCNDVCKGLGLPPF